MPEAVFVCASSELAEKGDGVGFDVVEFRRPLRAFALRHDDRVVAYLNRCVHVGVELDWLPGAFLDAEGRHIVCSVHGAEYAPHDGRCVGGPCGRGRLTTVDVFERDGGVWWRPGGDLAAPAPADQGSPSQ